MKRIKYIHEDRVVYEWEQSMAEIHIYISLPPLNGRITKNTFDIKILPKRLIVGLKGNPPYLDHGLSNTVVVDECFWTVSDRQELQIQLQKAAPGEVWDAPFEGHDGRIDPVTKTQITQQLIRERFTDEHPGFDFSQAEFSSQGGNNAPNPRTFMKF